MGLAESSDLLEVSESTIPIDEGPEMVSFFPHEEKMKLNKTVKIKPLFIIHLY